MAVIFQVRGTAFKPYYSRGSSKYGLSNNGSAPAIVSDGSSGIFGGSYIDTYGAFRTVYWPGVDNAPETNAFAILVRCIPRDDTNPPGFASLLCLTGGHSGGAGTNVIELVCTPSGNFRFHWTAENGSFGSNSIQTGNGTIAWANGVPTDLMISWNGDPDDPTGFKFSQDGVLISATQLWQPFSAAGVLRAMISTGVGDSSAFSYADINEIVIFNNAENPVYATRTDFWTAAQFDGSVYTDPGVANVRSGTAYTQAGVAETGTLDLPATTDVRAGVLFDGGTQEGTFGAGSGSGASKISAIHQAYLDHLHTVLPAGYTRLSNAYKIEDNPNVFLKQGYGVKIGGAENVNSAIQRKVQIKRDMTVVLTREYLARDDDAAAKATTEKLLIDDAALVQVDLQENYTLSDTALKSSWIGDSGVEYVLQSTNRFMKIEINFQTEYFEEAP